MTAKDTSVTCGACGVKFETNEDYLKHKCSKTGFTPTQVEHFDALSNGRFSKQSAKAQARGEEKNK